MELIVQAVQVSKSTVMWVCKERSETTECGKNSVSTPEKESRHTAGLLSCIHFKRTPYDGICMSITSAYGYSTLKKVLLPLKEAGLYSGGKTSLQKTVNNLSIYYSNINGWEVLMERENGTYHCCYLLAMKQKAGLVALWMEHQQLQYKYEAD